MSTGRYVVPNIFNTTADIALLNGDLDYLKVAINSAFQYGVISARPAFGSPGAFYYATDQAGGTFYLDTGGQWLQVGPSVNTTVLRNYFSGYGLQKSVATVMFIFPGQCSDYLNQVYLSSPATFGKSLSGWAAGSGNGMLDTGSIAINTWYHVFAIGQTGGTLIDFLCSLSVSSPTLPSGYLYQRRIGSFRTDGSGNILGFQQTGLRYMWVPSVTDYTGTASTTKTNVALNYVPSGVTMLAHLMLGQSRAAGAESPWLVSSPLALEGGPSAPSGTVNAPGFDITNHTTSSSLTSSKDVLTNSSAQVSMQNTTTDATFSQSIIVKGWTDLNILSGS